VYAMPYSGSALVAACKYTVLASTCDVAFITISLHSTPEAPGMYRASVAGGSRGTPAWSAPCRRRSPR
jgi:hypothetical protein